MFSGIAQPGDTYEWTAIDEAKLLTGNAIGLFVTINDTSIGRIGDRGQNKEEIWRTANGANDGIANGVMEPMETNNLTSIPPEGLAMVTPKATETLDANMPPPYPKFGSAWKRPQDKMMMVYVPSGTFLMGSAEESNQHPVHSVTLDSF